MGCEEPRDNRRATSLRETRSGASLDDPLEQAIAKA